MAIESLHKNGLQLPAGFYPICIWIPHCYVDLRRLVRGKLSLREAYDLRIIPSNRTVAKDPE